MKSPYHIKDFAQERLVPNYVPWHQRQMITDHVARYRFALTFIKKSDAILDAACGSGYGCYELAQKAASVTGIDIDPATIHYANQTYKNPIIQYRVESVDKLTDKGKTYNLITSFETIEHIKQQSRCIHEFYRVLKPGGMLLISTPNILVNGGALNPFHIHELTEKEFVRLLSPFHHVKVYGQKPMPETYLRRVIPQINKLPPGFIRWFVDSASKMFFRSSQIKLLSQYKKGYVPAFYLAVCTK